MAPIAVMLILCMTVGAQVAQVAQGARTEKVDLEVMKKIREEGMDRSKVMDTLSWLTDVIGPRLTGSPQMKHANEWTKARMTEYGLENAHLEAWGPFGRGWSLEKFSANVIAPVPFPIIGYPKAWTPGTNGPVVGDVVFADIRTEADFEKYRGKLKGAIVLSMPMREVRAQFKAQGERLTDDQLLSMANAGDSPGGRRAGGMPSEEQMRAMRQQMEIGNKRAAFIREEGAAVLVDYSRVGDGGTIFVSSGGPRDKNAPQALPSITLTVEHYGRILRAIEKGQKVRMEVDIQARFHDEDPMGYNTIAEIPGTDLKDEVVMLGGHLDSWHGGTGATDNAAGCAVAMEAVRIIKALGIQPRRTIRVGLWSGEEQGLLGSRAYAAQHFAERQVTPEQRAEQQRDPIAGMRAMNNPSAPLLLKPEHEKLSVYFNLDNGTGKIRGVYLQGNEAARSIFRAWLEPFRDLGASTLTISNTGGTDHLAFDGVGLPGFQFIQDPVEYDTRTHHSNMDVYERMQADDMKQASTIMAAFVYNAAMRDEKFPRKPLPANAVKPAQAPAPAAAAAPAAPVNGKPAKAGKPTEKAPKQK
ncbi:MAG: M20/M25/M40 family metallo-hydrolase [Blastocatellia bacterium]|nr:M20/M25/M40 family metallo-hydrolase [Blastocatellia bacterium]